MSLPSSHSLFVLQFSTDTRIASYPLQEVILPPEVKLESPPLTPPREQDLRLSPGTTINIDHVAAPVSSLPAQVMLVASGDTQIDSLLSVMEVVNFESQKRCSCR